MSAASSSPCSCAAVGPELGRAADFASFWRNVIDEVTLQQAVVWLDRELVVP